MGNLRNLESYLPQQSMLAGPLSYPLEPPPDRSCSQGCKGCTWAQGETRYIRAFSLLSPLPFSLPTIPKAGKGNFCLPSSLRFPGRVKCWTSMDSFSKWDPGSPLHDWKIKTIPTIPVILAWFAFFTLTLSLVYGGVFQSYMMCDITKDWIQKRIWDFSCLLWSHSQKY